MEKLLIRLCSGKELHVRACLELLLKQKKGYVQVNEVDHPLAAPGGLFLNMQSIEYIGYLQEGLTENE